MTGSASVVTPDAKIPTVPKPSGATRKISLKEAKELSKKGQFSITSKMGIEYDPVKEPNPDCKGNDSRNDNLYSCYNSLGIFFQKQIKNSIIEAIHAVHNKQRYEFQSDFLALHNSLYESTRRRINDDRNSSCPFLLEVADILVYYAYDNTKLQSINHNKAARESINFTYGWILNYYDKEAYVYSDPRLDEISKLLKSEIESFRKDESLLKIIDVCCFLMKEDIYYRPRWIQILQDIKPTVDRIDMPNNQVITILKKLCALCADMSLTPEEIENVERWH